MTAMKSRLTNIAFVISLAIFSLVALAGTLVHVMPHFGWLIDGVRSGSMTPSIPRGSLVIARPVQPDSIVLGDVIIYRSDSAEENYICHRVVGITINSPLAFDTKGDAYPFADPAPVPAQNLVARVVWHSPVIGFAAIFIKTPVGFIVSVILPGVIIAFLCFTSLYSELFKKKKENNLHTNK
jgi:signal peptidase I